MAVLLWCVTCGEEAVIVGEVPTRCLSPRCREDPGPATWTAHLPYRINENDRKFLRSIHVDSERANPAPDKSG